ncbi:MAG TPA: glycosyltransferase [Hanamia sp.]|nr:glycosyltransferase [Hanamia sp.]
MKIAVNAGSLSQEYSQIFLSLAKTNPKEVFLFLLNKETDSIFPSNIVTIIVEAKRNGAIGQMIYSIKLAAALKKYQADIFISEKRISLKTKIPQLLISPDLSFNHHSSFFNKKQLDFFKRNTPLYLSKATEIIVSSNFAKKEIVEKYKTDTQKIRVIYPEIKNDFSPVDFEERELIKEKYAEGNEFFVYSGNIGLQQNLLNLLKAFSSFKKRQKSKMQLLIVGNAGAGYNEFMEALHLYRFNKEVKVLENLSEKETQRIVSSSYAMVYIPFYETAAISALQAMIHVPLIVSSIGNFKEFFNEAALYADPQNFKDIAEKMMLMFKNEHLRKELTEKGRAEMTKFSGEKTASVFWEIIQSTAAVSNIKQ